MLPCDEAKVWQSAVDMPLAVQCLWMINTLKPPIHCHFCMQGSSSSVPPSTHTCVQITRVHFYPLVLVCQAFLSHKAQGRACTEPSPCLDVLSWHGSLLQRPQVSPLHFEFISLERIVLQHTQGKEADGSAVAGACSLLLSSSR